LSCRPIRRLSFLVLTLNGVLDIGHIRDTASNTLEKHNPTHSIKPLHSIKDTHCPQQPHIPSSSSSS
ncbi:hypothetical protein RDWZM_000064, partial [Blomia tropicalis]